MIDEVESSATPGQTYTVQVEDGKSVCDCPGFRFHGHCKHTDKYGMDMIMSQEAPMTPEEIAEAEWHGEPTTRAGQRMYKAIMDAHDRDNGFLPQEAPSDEAQENEPSS